MSVEAAKLLDVNGLDYSILFIYFTIVIAIGFLAGMLIPSTKIENERIGPMADQVKEQAKETGQEALEHGKQIVQETAQTATQKAQEGVEEVKHSAQESAQTHAQDMSESAKESAEQVSSEVANQSR